MQRVKEIFRDIKTKKQTTLRVKIRAGAKKNSVDGVIVIDQNEYIKISIKAQPIAGKANRMVTEFLAQELCVPKSIIAIKAGATSSYKVVKISL